jgi:hypothetical protein
VHVIYSPARADGRPIYVGPPQLQKLKAGWNRAVDHELSRAPNRSSERPLPHRPSLEHQPIAVIRAMRDLGFVVRNPGRASIRIAGRAIGRALAGRVAPGIARAAGVRIPSAVSLAIRLALGKVSIPREILRTFISRGFERERERRR